MKYIAKNENVTIKKGQEYETKLIMDPILLVPSWRVYFPKNSEPYKYGLYYWDLDFEMFTFYFG